MQCNLDNCGKLVQFNEIINHLQEVHNRARGDILECPVSGCNKSYTTLKSFADHIRKRHDEVVAGMNLVGIG